VGRPEDVIDMRTNVTPSGSRLSATRASTRRVDDIGLLQFDRIDRAIASGEPPPIEPSTTDCANEWTPPADERRAVHHRRGSWGFHCESRRHDRAGHCVV
jgi:hypothetical protein